MKYIFDFDDVLFNNTKQFKPHMFGLIALAGVPEDKAKDYYLEVREKEFSLKNMLKTLFERYGINEDKEKVYQNIMKESANFLNLKLIEEIKKVGKENCYIITNGDQEFNQDKIKYSGIGNLFKKIYIVPGSKKEAIKEICDENKKNKNEQVIFLDDKSKFIDDLETEEYPNLKTILYTGQPTEEIFNHK